MKGKNKMKKIYKKPITEVIYVELNYKILTGSNDKEPEITENIGANVYNFDVVDDEEDWNNNITIFEE